MEGIALLKTEPDFTEQMHVPIDNSVSYSFGKEIRSQESITIDLYWKALYEGEFTPIGKVIYGIKVLEKIKYLDKSEYVLRPDFINSLRLFN